MTRKYHTFREFWPFYVCEHSRPLTRLFHFIGTFSIFPLVCAAALYSPFIALFIPVTAYGFAWFSHFFIEKNKPATFKYPLWSLIGDFRMFGLMMVGKMNREYENCRKSENSAQKT